MKKYQWLILPISALTILFLLTINPGCLTKAPQDENLTAGELADQYLLHADAIRDYRSEYSVSSGTAENPSTERILYDYKAPSFARMEQTRSSSRIPGSFAITNGTSSSWYDAETRTYDLSSGMELSREYDYQAIVRRIVSDRNFSITERDASHGPTRYQIEVVTEPWSDMYTPYISSRIRAWVEPSTGLAWKVMTYYGCDSSPLPTTPPNVGTPTVCGIPEQPNMEIQYESIDVNTGTPDSYFDFIPPEGSTPSCVPKYVNYIEPLRTDTAVPIDQPLAGGVRFSLNESDSGRTITLKSGDIVEITLSTIPGLAYRWIMPTEGSGLTLLNAGPFYEMPEKTGDYYSDLMGRGYYRWRYRADAPGTEIIDGIFSISGCDIQGAKRFNLTVQVMNISPQDTPEGDIPIPPATSTTTVKTMEVPGPGTTNYSIPILLTDLDWKLASECGWTGDNLSQSASLFMDDCRIQQLLRDGWEITGIGYDMNLIGSRCRRSTHPDANELCDWCLDSGPTLSLGFKGIITVYLANLSEKKVIHYVLDRQGNTQAVSTRDSEIIIIRNGTVLYTFRHC